MLLMDLLGTKIAAFSGKQPARPPLSPLSAMSVSFEFPQGLPPEYVAAAAAATEVFATKQDTYGLSWLLLRSPSMTDQALIKAFRLRKLTEKASTQNLVGEPPVEDAMSLINYAAMAVFLLRQERIAAWPDLNLDPLEVRHAVDGIRQDAARLLLRKNHDYDEAWRSFRTATFIDLMLTKLYRIRSLEESAEMAPIQAEAEWLDIYNYAALLVGVLGN